MVSIIILVQDRFEYLKRCIDSILKNTRSDFELVLILQAINNPQILEYIDSLPCKKTIIKNKINNGVTPGRNQGIEVSKGDYLLFFDDDAWVSEERDNIPHEMLEDDWLERLIYPYKIYNHVGMTGQSGSYINPEKPGIFWQCNTVYADCDVVQGYCFMFSREVVNKIGGLDPYFAKFWHEESEYCLHAKHEGFRVINLGYIGVTHFGSGSGDDGSYGKKIKYMFDKWSPHFSKILVPRKDWK